MEIVVVIFETLRRCLQRIGPYLLVELLLPGGTLLALLLFLYRRRQLRLHLAIQRLPVATRHSPAQVSCLSPAA